MDASIYFCMPLWKLPLLPSLWEAGGSFRGTSEVDGSRQEMQVGHLTPRNEVGGTSMQVDWSKWKRMDTLTNFDTKTKCLVVWRTASVSLCTRYVCMHITYSSILKAAIIEGNP